MNHRIQHRRTAPTRKRLAAAVAPTMLVATLMTPAAHAVSGGTPPTGAGAEYVAQVDIGGERSCSGALIAPQWVITASACFATDPDQPLSIPTGPPAEPTTVTLKHNPANGEIQRQVVHLEPYLGRNIVLLRLDSAITDITTVDIGASAPQPGDTLYSAGYGRTSSDWTPETAQVGTFTVEGLNDETLSILGVTEEVSVCKGDAGGPVVRATSSGPELVGLNSTSWQHGCLGETTPNRGAVVSRLDTLGQWIETRLLGHWKLNGNLDGIHGNHALHASGDARPVAAGYEGKAVTFDGVDDYLSSDGPVVDTAQSFTVSAWVKQDELGGWPTAVSQDGQHVSAFKLQVSNTGVWSFVMFASDAYNGGGQSIKVAAKEPSKVGTWNHVVGVYDAEDKKIQLYLNGNLVDENSYSSAWKAGGPLQIGAAKWNNRRTEFFQGSIDAVRIYQRVLTSSEVASFANQAVLRAHYSMNEGNGPSTRDVVTGREANFQGNPSWTEDQFTSIHFDATFPDDIDYLTAPRPDIRTDRSYTVSAWVRAERFDTSSRQAVSMNHAEFSPFALGYRSDSDKWGFAVSCSATESCGWTALSVEQPVTGEWVHLTGVYDAVAREARLYVNGDFSAKVIGVHGWNGPGGLLIGRCVWTGVETDHWAGNLDDVRVHTGVLPEPEIAELAIRP